MESDLIRNDGRGPEIRGTRITVYDLLPYFFDPEATEEYIGKVYDLTVQQVAAARAAVFANADTVLARHLEIELRNAVGNPPEVVERVRLTRQRLEAFREWLARRQAEDRAEATLEDDSKDPGRYPSFREWMNQQNGQPVQGS